MQQTTNKEQQLKEVFDSFDADKNGTIQLKEIKQVAEKLGESISEEEVSKIMQKLDINGDGKIQFDEFQLWWEKGRKGKLEKLVFLQAQALKMVQFVQKYFSQAGITLGESAAPKQYDRHEITVNFGEEKEDGYVGFKLENYIKGENYTKKMDEISSICTNFDRKKTNIFLKIQSENPPRAKAQLEFSFNQINEQLKEMLQIDLDIFLKIQIFALDEHLIVLLTFQEAAEAFVRKVSMPLLQICQVLGEDFYFDFILDFKYNISIENTLESKKLFDNLLQGFSLKVYAETNTSLMKKLRKLLESSGVMQVLPLTLFRRTKLKLKLKTPQDVSDFFKKLGIKQDMDNAPGLSELLQGFTPKAQELKKAEAGPLNVGYNLSQFMQKNANQHTLIMVSNEVMVTCIDIHAKNASQLHKALFNDN